MNLNTSVSEINKIGATTAKRLRLLGIETTEDLLFYFPFRYEDFSKSTPIKSLVINQSANIKGTIELIQNKRSPRKRMNITEALISDETGSLKVVWFNQPFITKNLKAGDVVSISGRTESDYTGIIMKSPEYEKVSLNAIHTQGFVPNYHLTANLTQKQLRFFISQIIGQSKNIVDWLPDEIRKKQKFIKIDEAIEKIHFPKNKTDLEQARDRLSFDELFIIQLHSQLIKKENQASIAPVINFKEKDTKKFVDSLDFRLTNAQKKCAWEIIQDIGKEKPMMRLLEGDVGCGKTIVAVIAMLNASLNNFQSILMTPTEILARQHFNSIKKILEKEKIKIGLITKDEKIANFDIDKKNADAIAKNAQIIIGTHALIQEKINYENLGLSIIDEQHRFGVNQRKELIKKSGNTNTAPHLLSMTATPIPRSLALTIYGDLDISIINEMPKNRKKIITRIVEENKRKNAYDFIREKIKDGRQAFVVCPLIDESDKLGAKSVKKEFEKLKKNIFPDLKIEMLHGKIKAKEKEDIMKKFLENKINILVSTSVIEVGVDVPNASIMLIEGAERFGLAQLHQFRGRVGRSSHQSFCLLFSDNTSPKTINRLNALVKYEDGFDLANFDLKSRGPGEVYGTNQKGFPELKITNLFDYELIKKARLEAIDFANDKNLEEYPLLQEKIKDFNNEIHLE